MSRLPWFGVGGPESDPDSVPILGAEADITSGTRSRERRAKAAAASERIPIIVRESHRCKKCETRIKVGGTICCTLQLLRLLDQDRGGDGAGVKIRRIDRRAPPGANRFTNYKLKDCVPMLTGVGMVDFPGSMAALPYYDHTTYLSSDLLGTKALYDYLTGRLEARPELRDYYDRLCAPLTPALVAMTERGICADTDFIRSECERLDRLAESLIERHRDIYGVEIGTTASIAGWLWGTLKLKPGRYVRQGNRWVPSLDHDHLIALLARHNCDTRICGSLALIDSLRRATGLRSQLGLKQA